MKKFIFGFLVGCGFTMCISLYNKPTDVSHTYEAEAYYNSVYNYFITQDGEAWAVDGRLSEGNYILTFDDNCTPHNKYDDIIINAIRK